MGWNMVTLEKTLLKRFTDISNKRKKIYELEVVWRSALLHPKAERRGL